MSIIWSMSHDEQMAVTEAGERLAFRPGKPGIPGCMDCALRNCHGCDCTVKCVSSQRKDGVRGYWVLA